MDSSIMFSELLRYTEIETARWKEWFLSHLQALEVPCDVAGVANIKGLLLHIFGNELYFAHALLELPQPDWEKLPSTIVTVENLFGLADEAHRQLTEFIHKAEPPDWDSIKELGFSNLKASKRKMLAQTLLHALHHRAQLAMLLRQHGFADLWIHDVILSDVMG